jgi:hypothetical protein
MSFERMPPGPANPYLIDAMVNGARKSRMTAYRLWYLCGVFGVHNFYLGKPVLGGLQAGSLPLSVAVLHIAKALDIETLAGQAVGSIGLGVLGALGLSLLADCFLIPSRVRAYSDRLRAELEAEADWQAA